MPEEYHRRHGEQLVDLTGDVGDLSTGIAIVLQSDGEKQVRLDYSAVDSLFGP